MESKQEKAIQNFKSGFNCSQSVLSAFCHDFNMDIEQAMSISCAFGGGMGRLQETCGAVTGAFMVFGLFNCNKYTANNDRKNFTYSMVQEFDKQFKAIHHTNLCKNLIKCDLNTDEGQKYATDHNVFETVCEKCVTDSVSIIENLLNKIGH